MTGRSVAHHRTGKRWRWTVVYEPVNAHGPKVGAEFPMNEICDAVLVGFLSDGYVVREDRTGAYWVIKGKLLYGVDLTHQGWRRNGALWKPQRSYSRAWMTEVRPQVPDEDARIPQTKHHRDGGAPWEVEGSGW